MRPKAKLRRTKVPKRKLQRSWVETNWGFGPAMCFGWHSCQVTNAIRFENQLDSWNPDQSKNLIRDNPLLQGPSTSRKHLPKAVKTNPSPLMRASHQDKNIPSHFRDSMCKPSKIGWQTFERWFLGGSNVNAIETR